MAIKILESKFLTQNILEALNNLLCELRPKTPPPKIVRWRGILKQKDVIVFLCHAQGKIVGMAILRWHELPAGKVGIVEDVVVKNEYRGRGYGSALMKAIIKFAKKENMAYIDLTSRPDRVAANKLYHKFGWKIRRTNVYRLDMKDMWGVGHPA